MKSLGLAALLLLFACSYTSPVFDGGDGDNADDGYDQSDSVYQDVCTPELDPSCKAPCQGGQGCGPNTYCGLDGYCRADCIQGGSECGPGSVCMPHGLCVGECAKVEVDLDRIVPTVMLLIDQSGSMGEGFGGQSRWNAIRFALVDATDAVVPALQAEILFGASLYTSHGGTSGGDCPILQTVNPALGNAQAIRDLLRDNGPDGDTPTGESIVAVTDLLDALPPESITPLRLIVLATDGEPDTCEVPNPQEGQAQSIQGAEEAFARGVKTVILSVGRDVSAGHMQDMANAGAGLPIGGTENAPYYVADDPAGLVAAFAEISQGVRSCVFALDGVVEPMEYGSYGDVRLDGQPLVFNDPDGWRLLDPSTLELLGEACGDYLANPGAILTASFPCGVL